MRLRVAVLCLIFFAFSVSADLQDRVAGELLQATPAPEQISCYRDSGDNGDEFVRALGDTCTSGIETSLGFFSGWSYYSGEKYGILVDGAAIDTCCWTTEIDPLEICTYVVVMGEGTQGADIQFIAHAELWDTTGVGACPANPNAMICSGSGVRWSLPDPPDGTNWIFGPLCFPLDGCSNLTHPITDDHFAVVVFDSTGDGTGDDVHMVVDAFVDACYDWVDVGGGWEVFDNYTADYTFTMFSRYECTGMDVPVEMSSLSAVAIPGAVDLRWRTESEDENLGFNVFRGVDALDRMQINADMIPGHGTTMFPNDYSFTDTDVSAGNRYSYWVSDLDYSGVETFHGPVSVLIPQETPSELALSSAGWNGSEMNLALSLPSEGETMLAVYNIAGREIATLVDQVLPAGQAMVTWDGSSSSGDAAASGTYVIRLVHESGVANVKAVISR